MDRIEETLVAIDTMIQSHDKLRPVKFGGGVWDAKEEFEVYRKQVGDRYTPLQWKMLTKYFNMKFDSEVNKQ